MRGKLIVFEGIDGSGKAVQIRRLVKRLRNRGFRIRLFGYPDIKSDFGEILNRFLEGKRELDPKTQFLTFAADIMKDQEIVNKLLKKGRFVIMDRYLPSTLAYQVAHGLSFKKGLALLSALQPIQPDLIILIDIEPRMAVERRKKRRGNRRMDRHDRNVRLLKRVRRNYLKMAKEGVLAKRWVVVDGRGGEREVSEDVWRRLELAFKKLKDTPSEFLR